MRWTAAALVAAAGCATTEGPDGASDPSGGGKADEAAPDQPFLDVVFSPQPLDRSHNARVAAIFEQLAVRIDEEEDGDGAAHSVDIAMYSFSDARIKAALAALVDRGVAIRMIYEPARADRSSPEGSRSAGLEDIGVDVRWINKIMHHKFAIVDGPRDDAALAATAVLVTGSGNWSNGAATRYDENTLFARGQAELVLRMQREFDLLWGGSRDFVWGDEDEFFESTPIADDDIAAVDDPNIEVGLTSANFRVRTTSSGPSFSLQSGRSAVADLLVSLIDDAEESIHLASGHLRSRPVAEALERWHAAHPDGDLRIYLDGQEYLSSWFHADQVQELEECLEAAGSSVARRQRCTDKGFLFSYQAHLAGIPLRYKYYAYRWDAAYADQMHNKFFVIDGRVVASGSYNLSDNAEHETMENMIVFRDPALAAVFEAKFEELWRTGEADGRYEAFLEQVQGTEGDVLLVFPAMALDWDQVTALKRALAEACPAVDSEEYRENPTQHRTCPRE